MITLLNRKKLLTDTSSMKVARVTNLLKDHQIPYEIQTNRNQGIMSNMIHANMASRTGGGGAASYNAVNGIPTFSYHIFVKKKDYGKAKEITVS